MFCLCFRLSVRHIPSKKCDLRCILACIRVIQRGVFVIDGSHHHELRKGAPNPLAYFLRATRAGVRPPLAPP
jgi:hypothetical protein